MRRGGKGRVGWEARPREGEVGRTHLQPRKETKRRPETPSVSPTRMASLDSTQPSTSSARNTCLQRGWVQAQSDGARRCYPVLPPRA